MALVDLVDRLFAKGVVLGGDARLSMADVDLVYLRLQLLIAPAEEIDLPRHPAREAPPGPWRMTDSPADKLLTAPPDRNPFAREGRHPDEAPWRPVHADPDNVDRGLAQLVLTIVELLRQLMERQALRRVEAGGLDDETVERLGGTLMVLADRMEQLKQTFGLRDEDLNLNLGPLGRLL
jgi:hypothetical protein